MDIKFIQCNKGNYSSGRNDDIKYIVIHYTANNGDTAENNGNYFKNNVVFASAHYFVDENETIQSVADEDTAWQVGATYYKHLECRNSNAIGIEMCSMIDENGKYYILKDTIDRAVEIAKYLMEKYNISIDNVLRHYDVTGKKCPAPFVDDITLWDDFKNKLIEDDEMYYIRKSWDDTATQAGVFSVKDNAIDFCKNLYSVFDKDGNVVYGNGESVVQEIDMDITYKEIMNGYLYEIPFDKIERIEYVNGDGTLETVSDGAKRIKWNGRPPDIITNAELFNMTTGTASTAVVDNGEVHYLKETFGIGFKEYKTPIFSYKNNVNAEDFVGAYPVLVRNGDVGFTTIPSGLSGSRGRTALGIGDNKFGVLVIPEQVGYGDATLYELSDVFIQNGYNDAINLDGGGSTSYATNEFSYEQGRKVRGFICVWYKDGKGNKLTQPSQTGSTMLYDTNVKGGVDLIITATGGLNIRGATGSIIKTLPYNSTVKWYGYYTVQWVYDGKWLYVQAEDGTTGYVSSDYLK